MKTKLILNKVVVKKSNIHGYGVFADKAISQNEVFEECHTLLTDNNDQAFNSYYFGANEKNAIPLG